MNNITLGERIKSHRTRLHLTQEQLSQRLGVSAQAVSKWEHNQSCPDISVLPELADLFGTSVDELLGRGSAEIVTKPETEAKKTESSFVWSWNSGKHISSILFALYIFAMGALMLVNSIFDYDISLWTVTWTLGVLFIGIYGLLSQFSVFSLSLCFGGAYLLLSKYGLIFIELKWSYVFPALMLLWGISLLIDVLVKKKSIVSIQCKPGLNSEVKQKCICDNGWLDCELCFGEERAAVATELLRGGSVDASFGSFTVDFSACAAASADCTLEVEHGFGSLTLLFPKHLAVEVQGGDSLFGATEIEGSHNDITRGTVKLDVDSSFGVLNIRYVD